MLGALLLAALSGLAGCGTGDEAPPAPTQEPPPTDSPTAEPTDSPSPEPTDEPEETTAVPVYFVTQTSQGLRLAREFHPAEAAADPVTAAVRRMLVEPPSDPDYRSLWPGGSDVLDVRDGPGAIVVDVTGPVATTALPRRQARLAMQQLAYTATAAAQRDVPVRLLVDGQPPTQLWGRDAVRTTVRRADPLAVRLRVQINDPGEGAEVPSTFPVTGEAAVFEAALVWRVEQDGSTVAEGTAMTTEGQTFAPFTFEVALDGVSGPVTLIVSETDASSGEGFPPVSDSKSLVVVE